MFNALSELIARRPRAVLAATLLFVVVALVAGRGVGDRLTNGGTDDPGSESSRAAALLDERFPTSRSNLALLVRADGGVDDPAVARQGRALAARLAAEDGVAGVASYWQSGAASLRARDGSSALIVARLDGDETAQDDVLERIAPAYRGTSGDLTVELGGRAAIRTEMQSTIRRDLVRGELIALPLVFLILVLAFGSAVAALLPIGVGIVAIVGTTAVLRVITGFTDVSIFAQNLTTALGLGLAIDYALLIVRRYREELAGGAEPRAAVATTLQTAGRTVLFSAVTIAFALAAMLVFPLYFLRSFAYAGVSVVLLAAAAALIVLPALLLVLGRRVDALDLRRLVRRRRSGAGAGTGTGWYRLAKGVMRRAPFVAISVTALLVALGLPFAGVEFGGVDDRQLPAAAEPRVVADTMRSDYAGVAGATIEVAARDRGPAALAAYAERVSALPGVERVDAPDGTYAGGARSEPRPDPARTSGGVGYLSVVPSTAVADDTQASQDLVAAVRAEDGDGVAALAGGPAAALADTRAAIGDRLPLAVAIIVLTTLTIVFLLTGSVVLPLQAIATNALSLTAMLGAIVFVFQDGNLAGLLAFTATGSIETTLPVLMFCVAFGLSMDYGIFVLARAKEEHERSGDNREAIATALQKTGGVVTAAALILGIVFVAMGTSQIMNIKMMGLGIALAVIVDATIVRCLLVPALMALTGRWTWWAPRPLRRLHTRIGLREEPAAA